MRKVTFGGAVSLDNFIARKDDSYDWIMWSKESGEHMRDYWKTIDTIIMGRRTYEVALSHGPLPVHKSMKTYIFSRTIKQPQEATGVRLRRRGGLCPPAERGRRKRHLRDGRWTTRQASV